MRDQVRARSWRQLAIATGVNVCVTTDCRALRPPLRQGTGMRYADRLSGLAMLHVTDEDNVREWY